MVSSATTRNDEPRAVTDRDPPPPQWQRAARDMARSAWRLLRPALIGAANVLLALILLFEEWGWRPLAAALASLARFRIVARLEDMIARLPPYPALLIFAAPGALLFPVKIGALWLFANGHFIKASLLLAAAKVTSTALVARIYMLTRPALMQIAWFRRAYDWFMPWKDALFARVRASFVWRYARMLKSRAKQEARRLMVRIRPWLADAAQRARVALRRLWQRYFGQSM